MPENNTNNSLGSFSDLNDEIIIKNDDDFQLFSHGNMSEYVFKTLAQESKQETSVLDTGKEEYMLAPLTPTKWNKDAAFYFDFDDEEDIKKHADRMKEINSLENRKYSLHKIVEKLIESHNLNLVADLEKRFAGIVFSYIKHTREKIDVVSSLKAPINKSGLGLSEEITNKLVNILTEIKDKIDGSGGKIVKDVEDEKKEDEKPQILSNMDPRQQIIDKSKEGNIPFVARGNDSGRQKIEDIKKPRQVISPIEELGEITLTIFRRLSDNPTEAAQKIINKIYSFERESFIRKASAIKYWRQSEVYKLYLDIGKLSMEKNIPIEKIIEQRILANEKTLTNEEFKAISDLNKKIRF